MLDVVFVFALGGTANESSKGFACKTANSL